MAKLTWKVTGDTIDLVPDNQKVYEYFLDQINAHNVNQYYMPDLGFASLRDELLNKFEQLQSFVNHQLRLKNLDFIFDPIDHNSLNRLHTEWVRLHQVYPNLGRVFDHNILNRINKLIHAIEELSQNFEIETRDPRLCFANPFGTSICKSGYFNVLINFNNLGRSTFNKWINGDSVGDTDTNDFKEFYTSLKIRATPVSTKDLPTGYQDWCKKQKVDCIGECLPLANFDNIEQNLLKYKQMILLNSLVENNFIILE